MHLPFDPLDVKSQGEPWFEDGNLVLIADDGTGFRIHRGVLARQSEVFESMLSMPTPTPSTNSSRLRDSSIGLPDGCNTVEMHDKSNELSTLLEAIYDGESFHIQSLEDFLKTSAVLRLATKYLMKNIRRKTILALTEAWAYTLDGHDRMVARAIADPQTEGQTSYPFVHPLHVVNLAREVDVRLILPSALYFLSMYPISDIQRADHPKLTAESQRGLPKPSTQLSYEDLGNYTLMYQHRIDFILKFCRNLNGRPPSPLCRRAAHLAAVPDESCKLGFARLASRVSRSWLSRTGNLHWMTQTVKWSENRDINLCPECKVDYKNFVENVRREEWDRLPGVVGLPSWTEMLESDLPN